MAFEKLTKTEQEVVLQCMKLILEENYIEDWEFQTRLGITRDELHRVISEWPHLQDENDSKDNPDLVRILAINNSLNEVLHGLNVSDEIWNKWLNAPREEVKRIYYTWAKHKGWSRSGIK